MTVPLRDALQRFLQDWRDDVPPTWQPALADVEPDFGAIGTGLALEPNDVLLPFRKGHSSPLAPADSHVFRALDLPPDAVRVVLIGQDPYPRLKRATGRSFEQGDFVNWKKANVAESLRRILQALAHHRRPDWPHVTNDGGWQAVADGIESGVLDIERPRVLFDRWQAAGVLCLNLGLTLSRFDKPVQQAHMAMWKPIVRGILLHLARRPGRDLVVILWGGDAQRAFDAMGIDAAFAQGGQPDRLVTVRRNHPAFEDEGEVPFLRLPDPFTEVDQRLAALQAVPINW
jgi:uracil-DNA glycosylase